MIARLGSGGLGINIGLDARFRGRFIGTPGFLDFGFRRITGGAGALELGFG